MQRMSKLLGLDTIVRYNVQNIGIYNMAEVFEHLQLYYNNLI